jgi:hypothetical protein
VYIGIDMDAINSQHHEFGLAFDYVQSRSFSRLEFGSYWKLKEWLYPNPKFTKYLNYLNTAVSECIHRARAKSRADLAQSAKSDLLSSMLMSMTDDDGKPNKHYNEGNNSNNSYIIHTFTPTILFICIFYFAFILAEMRDFVLNFLVAGRDTTAVNFFLCIYIHCAIHFYHAHQLIIIDSIYNDCLDVIGMVFLSIIISS